MIKYGKKKIIVIVTSIVLFIISWVSILTVNSISYDELKNDSNKHLVDSGNEELTYLDELSHNGITVLMLSDESDRIGVVVYRQNILKRYVRLVTGALTESDSFISFSDVDKDICVIYGRKPKFGEIGIQILRNDILVDEIIYDGDDNKPMLVIFVQDRKKSASALTLIPVYY